MRQKDNRGRQMKSDRVRVKAVPHDKIDTEKMAQALISIAKDIAEKKTALSRPKGE